MSENIDAARRTLVSVTFDGADITEDIKPYLLSVTYIDNEEDTADDLQIQLQDRESVWLESWLDKAVGASAAAKLKLSATITPENWGGDSGTLPTGNFELDSVDAGGPPSTITIKGISLSYSSPIRQTKKSKAWENYTLSGIASEIAGSGGLSCMYAASSDPSYDRREQEKTSDIEFLSDLCHDAGISLKYTDSQLVLFDQSDYEGKAPVMTIRRGDGQYIKYKLSTGSANTQYGSCRVSYVDPATAQCIEGTATAPGEDAESAECLEITARVKDAGEAMALAEKQLRLHNKFNRTASFTLLGNTGLVAGVTVQLVGFGGWDGKYMVKQARHVVSASGGYTTQIVLRKVL